MMPIFLQDHRWLIERTLPMPPRDDRPVAELALLTWPEIEQRIAKSPGVIVPTGSIEQHGVAGLLGTDAICAEAVARRAAAVSGAIVAPTVAIGMAQFNLGFPGTLSLRPSTMVALMVDYVASLARIGFTHVYVVNGHGGNLAPIRTAFQEIYAERSFGRSAGGALYCRLVNWWDPPAVNVLRQALYGASEGFHVTPSEVAITAALHPERVVPSRFPAGVPTTPESDVMQHGGDPYFDAADHRARYPDGRVGSDPSLATAAEGERILAVAGEAIAEDYARFVASR
jgi:creatinine amidohydrolase